MYAKLQKYISLQRKEIQPEVYIYGL